MFWKLNTVDYDKKLKVLLKKQIKFNFLNKEEVDYFEKNIKNEKNVKIKILNQINNPTGRIKFKDVRKVDIGYCRNDIINPKNNLKVHLQLFCNYFSKKINNKYQEYHVKLFNSGKVEIPGIQNEDMLNNVVEILISYLQPEFDKPIEEIKEKKTINIKLIQILIGNYYLNREKLVQIFEEKYKIKCGMDSCSYPGIQCKYKLENNIEISFMIFRTGSVLIVGKCNDTELYEIYNFLKNVFHDEYSKIVESESFRKRRKKETK